MVLWSTLITNLVVTLVTVEFAAHFMYHSVMPQIFHAFALKVTQSALIRNINSMSRQVMSQINITSSIKVTLITCVCHIHCVNVHAIS